MAAEAPHYALTSFSLPGSSTLGYNSFIPGFDLPYELYGGLSTIFRDIRQLTFAVNTQRQFSTAKDLMKLCGIRTAIEYQLLSLKHQRLGLETTDLDHHLEICRLAALAYVQRALHVFLPAYAVIRSLKLQLISSFEEKERKRVNMVETSGPSILLWALFMGGILLSLDEEDEHWFAQRIAQHVRAAGITTWAQMESWLRKVCWLDNLYTPTCKSLWQRVEDAVAECRHAEAYLYRNGRVD